MFPARGGSPPAARKFRRSDDQLGIEVLAAFRRGGDVVNRDPVRCRWSSSERHELGADPAQAVLVLAERSTRKRARRWSKTNSAGERRLLARTQAYVVGYQHVQASRPRDKPRSRSEVARSPRLLGAVACSDITSPVVTSTHRILHSLEAKFDDDRQAENLRAAQSRCRRTAVRCSRGLRAFRARLSGPTD
jgi:hypothetical protein